MTPTSPTVSSLAGVGIAAGSATVTQRSAPSMVKLVLTAQVDPLAGGLITRPCGVAVTLSAVGQPGSGLEKLSSSAGSLLPWQARPGPPLASSIAAPTRIPREITAAPDCVTTPAAFAPAGKPIRRFPRPVKRGPRPSRVNVGLWRKSYSAAIACGLG